MTQLVGSATLNIISRIDEVVEEMVNDGYPEQVICQAFQDYTEMLTFVDETTETDY